MLFNSVHFALFAPIVVGLYFLSPQRLRNPLLLLASCYFYMAFVPAYILILFALIALDYSAALVIESSSGMRRRTWLIISLAANISFLATFKYANFLNDNLRLLFSGLTSNWPIPHLNIILPIGLSFHTFQSMAYTIEVYRGRFRAERNLATYALYVLFFPQMVAGPIERPHNLLPQLKNHYRFDYDRVVSGLQLMLWGFFQKLVIADRLAAVVGSVYGHPQSYSGTALLIATYFFAIQIYCDFGGYTDIARGIARVLGIELIQNFRRPYLASSVSDFWHRWHISLSTWFRDYLYIPLGGNRVSRWHWFANILFVFMISGLWHGASWTFVVWGLLHGFYLVTSIITSRIREVIATWSGLARVPAVHRWVQRFVTFNAVSLAWVFFRANSISDAWYTARHLLPTSGLHTALLQLDMSRSDLGLVVALTGLLFAVHMIEESGVSVSERVLEQPRWVRWAVYYAAVFSIIFMGRFQQVRFIYFQF